MTRDKLQQFLGHSSLLTTARYAHLTDVACDNCEQRINQLIDGFTVSWGEDQMILLSSVMDQFETDFLNTYQGQVLPVQRKVLNALKICRTKFSPGMQVSCIDCDHQSFIPHSCGHRNCPHCQHHESQFWIENQLKKQLPCDYFMLIFTLPTQLRPLAWRHQKLVYRLMFDCVWETLQSFSRNDQKLVLLIKYSFQNPRSI